MDRSISYREDSETIALPEVTSFLKVRRRNTPMGFAEVKTLIEAFQPGLARAANLERYGKVWRLRFLVRLDGGKRVRQSIVIANAAILEWVSDYIGWARSHRREYKAKLSSIRFERWWNSDGKQLAESIAARLDEYCQIASL